MEEFTLPQDSAINMFILKKHNSEDIKCIPHAEKLELHFYSRTQSNTGT